MDKPKDNDKNKDKDKDTLSPTAPTLLLFGELEEQNVRPLLTDLLTLPPDERVVLVVDSTGGDEMLGWSLFSLLRLRRDNVLSIGLSRVFSSATIPFLAPPLRLLVREANLCLHEGFSSFDGRVPHAELDAWYGHVNSLRSAYYSLLASRSNRSRSYWVRSLRGRSDLWLDARDALRLGLVSKLI